jgi:ribonucleoside-diphosphate reductase alpha chain
LPGYADKNIPNRAATPGAAQSQNVTTAKELVEKTQDLAKKIAEAKQIKSPVEAKAQKVSSQQQDAAPPERVREPVASASLKIPTDAADRMGVLVGSHVVDGSGALQTQAAIMQQFNEQFAHFGDDAPACDICGSITVRNGTCYKCYNCGNSMGCS